MSQARPTKAEVNTYAETFALYGDKTRAWRATFPKSTSTPDNVNKSASKFHKIPEVHTRVSELEAMMCEKADKDFDINAEWLLGELKAIHELDVLDIFKDDLMGFKPLNEWPKEWRINVSGIDIMEMSKGDESVDMMVKKIKWPDKTKNLEMIGKHVDVQAFVNNAKVEHSLTDDFTELMGDASSDE